MTDLIVELLKEIDIDESVTVNEEGYFDNHPLIVAVQYLASSYLTDGDIYEHTMRLSSYGYSMYPGEKDSFGWLTGCIKTKRGVIVFG